jgi:hypothetical protein
VDSVADVRGSGGSLTRIGIAHFAFDCSGADPVLVPSVCCFADSDCADLLVSELFEISFAGQGRPHEVSMLGAF